MIGMNRRQFVGLAAATLAGCMFEPVQAAQPPKPVDVGPITDFAKDGPYNRWAINSHFIVIRDKGKIYAVCNICTHKQGILTITGADRSKLKCPKHNSEFSLAGQPTKGPATQPLPRFGISLDQQRRVIVNPAQQFDQANWNDPAVFVKV